MSINHTVYVGNFTNQVSEYMLLKLFEPFGVIKIDYLWHTSGPKLGNPKGFAFITLRTPQVNILCCSYKLMDS